MAAPIYTRADFRSALTALLPQGRVWPRDEGAAISRVMDGLSAIYARSAAAAVALLVDAFPTGTVQLLPQWEASLGLPDPCTGPAVGLQERRGRVVSKLTDAGGQSRAYFVGLAAGLGFPGCTITEFRPFTAGRARAGDAAAGADWAHVWRLNIPVDAGFYSFRAGASAAGEAVRAWGSITLECVVRREAPAHTVVLFGYSATEDWLTAGGAEDWGTLDQLGSEETTEDWGTLG